MALIFLIITSIGIVGCGKKTENEPITIKVLESQKDRPESNRNKTNEKHEEDILQEDEDEDVEQEEISQYRDIDINLEDAVTYTYFSLKSFPEKSNKKGENIIEIDSYQKWLEIKTTYPEVFSLINQELLAIENNYFIHSKGYLVINKEIETDKFITTKKITKQGENLEISYVQKDLLSDMDGMSDIISVIPNFQEKIAETAVIYFFNREEVELIDRSKVSMIEYEGTDDETENVETENTETENTETEVIDKSNVVEETNINNENELKIKDVVEDDNSEQ